jgi:hypothetical protein
MPSLKPAGPMPKARLKRPRMFSNAAGKERAENRADSREQEAAAGRTLAESLMVDEATLPATAGRGLEALDPDGGQAAAAEVVRRDAELAKRLFP